MCRFANSTEMEYRDLIPISNQIGNGCKYLFCYMVLQPAIGFKELSHKLSQKRRSSVWNIRKARLSTPLLVSRPQVEWTLQKSYRFNNLYYFLLQKLPLRRFLLIISNAWQGLSSNTTHFIFGALQKAKEKKGACLILALSSQKL